MIDTIENIKSASEALSHLPTLPFEDRDQLPSRSGIYIVTVMDREILYIGKTNNFYTRWLSHHKLSDMRKHYNIGELLIAYCELPQASLTQVEARLIKSLNPPLNLTFLPKRVVTQVEKSFTEEKALPSVIPRELRLWVYQNCNCTCQICGDIVDGGRIGIIQRQEKNSFELENLALICRSCRSRVRGNGNIEEFRDNQKKLLFRDLNKLKEALAFNFKNGCSALSDLENFINNNEIEFQNERN
ncbi:GIY-YIG nuclease family protein [Vibrio owensii]|uniref:GIY-YIG nuclease family protein n=1 Tax=Vibrio owensii TaxID=696485 RepID=UPI00391BCEA1